MDAVAPDGVRLRGLEFGVCNHSTFLWVQGVKQNTRSGEARGWGQGGCSVTTSPAGEKSMAPPALMEAMFVKK